MDKGEEDDPQACFDIKIQSLEPTKVQTDGVWMPTRLLPASIGPQQHGIVFKVINEFKNTGQSFY